MGIPLRVLLVEDSEDDALLAVAALRRGGFEPMFEIVQTSEAMQAALQRGDWELVITDYSMPHFSGPQALVILQASGQDVPCIVISSAVGEDTTASLLRAGAQDFILKSSLSRLVPAVQRELREAQLRKAGRQAQAALRANEERFRALVEHALDMTFLVTPGGIVEYASPSVERILGYSPDEVVGRNGLDFLHPDDRARIAERIARQADGSRLPNLVEHRIRDRAGNWHSLEGTGQGWYRSDGMLRIVVNSRDITERQQVEAAEREQRLLSEALRNTAATLSRTLDFGEVLDQILDHVQHVIPYDTANFMLLEGGHLRVVRSRGYDERGQKAWLHDHEFRIVDRPLMQEMLQLGQPVVVTDTWSDPRWVRFSETNWIRSHIGCPIRPRGEVVGIFNLDSSAPGFFTPVHIERLQAFADQAAAAYENAQLFSRLKEALLEAEEASRLKSQFLAVASHELRTPLTNILGSLSVVLEQLCNTRDEEVSFLQAARQAGQHLSVLVDDILDFAQLEAGHMYVMLKSVDVNAIVADVCAMLGTCAQERALTLEADVSCPLPSAWADPASVRRILLNLIGNAIKFTEQGEIKVRVTTDASRSALSVTVQDTGIGIPADVQKKLFQPFVQGDGSVTRRHGGTGLGLSLSRRLAELMGGSLTLSSAGAQQGSTFTLTLPASTEADLSPVGAEAYAR